MNDRLTPAQFARIAQMMRTATGVQLLEGRAALVRSRLRARLEATGAGDFDAYLALLASPSGKKERMRAIELMTTQTTQFFRERAHFQALVRDLVPRWRHEGRRARIWSAGCSTGQEPYSIAMTLAGTIAAPASWSVHILGSDISGAALAEAEAGVYAGHRLRDVPVCARHEHFEPVEGGRRFRVKRSLKRWITFRHVNLLGDWVVGERFDAVFCRNVMIYFDEPTTRTLLDRLRGALRTGGRLFVGEAECHGAKLPGYRHVAPGQYEVVR